MAISVNPLLKRRQQETIDDVHRLLNEYGKCLMIRPTGFGKTYLLMEKFTKEFLHNNDKFGKKVLYVYPLDIIKVEIIEGKSRKNEYGEIVKEGSKYIKKNGIIRLEDTSRRKSNMIFMSYQNITTKFNKDNSFLREFIIANNIGLIILDEAHRSGSESFDIQYDTISDLIGPDKIWMIGATATPNRMDDSSDKPPVTERIFDNHTAFEYGLGNALEDGLIPEMVYMASKFTIKDEAEKRRNIAKSKFGDDFDLNSFNTELTALMKETGDEPDVIAKALGLAGYNPVTEKYYKFIVFVKDISDLVNQAEDIERWFNEAFNIILKNRYNLHKSFKIRTHLIASADPNGDISNLVSKGKGNRFKHTDTRKVSEIVEEDYCVDLLLTVNMINMGYHVDNITGIMMKRGTKSEITYYQQLGRALSVNATHKPIIIDCVNNIGEKFWFKKDAKHRGGITGSLLESLPNEKEPDFKVDFDYVNSLNSYKQFLERFNCEDNMVERLKIEFLYLDRHMPLYILASHLNISCKELIKKLVNYNIRIRTEDAEYNRVLNRCDSFVKIQDKDRFENEQNKLRFINCKQATYESKCKYIRNKATPTMYNLLNNIRTGGNKDA